MNRTNREKKTQKKKQKHHSVGHVQGSRVANSNKQRIKRNSWKAIDQGFVYLSHHMHSIQKIGFVATKGKIFFSFESLTCTQNSREKNIKNRSVN